MTKLKNKAVNTIVKGFLKKSKRNFRFAMISMTIAVWGIIVITSIINGFDRILVESIVNFFPHIIVSGEFNEEHNDAEETFKFNYGGAMLSFRGKVEFIQLIEFDESEFFSNTLIKGNFDDGIVIGKDLAEKLNAEIGSTIAVFKAKGIIPIFRNYKVSGIFQSGVYSFDSNIILFKNVDDEKEFSGIILKNPYKPEIFKKKNLKGYNAITWKESNEVLTQALEVDSLIAFIVTFFIVLMSGFSISNSITFSILTRKREIGIIRSLGLKTGEISKIFIRETLIISILSFFAGFFTGFFTVKLLDFIKIPLPKGIFYLEYLPVNMNWINVIIALMLNISIAFIFSLITTRNILKFDVMEALRDDE